MLHPVARPGELAPSLLDDLALSALVITVGSSGEESILRLRAECVSLCSSGWQGILTVLVLTPLCLSSPLDTSCLLRHRYLLRLGMGEQELATEEEFSRVGRVNAMLARRLALLAEVGVCMR